MRHRSECPAASGRMQAQSQHRAAHGSDSHGESWREQQRADSLVCATVRRFQPANCVYHIVIPQPPHPNNRSQRALWVAVGAAALVAGAAAALTASGNADAAKVGLDGAVE
jgi:hypothetical protein